MDMEQVIREKLAEIENKENVSGGIRQPGLGIRFP